MNFINTQFILLLFSTLLTLGLMVYVRKSNKENQINKLFFYVLLCTFIIAIGVICQAIGSNLFNINPIYFEYIIYIGTCFLPVALFFTSLSFANTKIKFKRIYFILFIIPIISLLAIWTNNYHKLFYSNYSLNLNENTYGPYAYIHMIYTYGLFALSIIYLLNYSIKNAGFFSKQSILIVLGSLLPITVNLLGSLAIIPMTVYITPISFTFAIAFFALAIFKFDFLKVAPIAMQRIVDRMSDSFLVVNEDGIITDFNDTFLKTFKLSSDSIRNGNFMKFLKSNNLDELAMEFADSILEKCKTSEDTILVKKEFQIRDKYFNIEASGIFSKNSFLGTLILLKDVTQHVIDKNIIEDKQSMLMEKERLASLGQMIGGIAHNLKTPIMSIAGAAEGLTDLTKEYDISIGDPTVTDEDYRGIVADMNEWIEKIKTHTSYMSDIINAVKGQAVAFAETTGDTFTISELLTHVDVLMRHELKNALVELNTSILVPTSLAIKGNINSLVQVINNIISNAIQAYGGTPNKNIDFIIKIKDDNVIFTIQDYGCGMSRKVQDKLFKEMITTKGKNGTGLGLFMSYSNIRAHFNGNMTFESEEGKGTKFDIMIPLT